MTISDINLVLQLAKTCNFSETAFECNLSQSSLSKHISQVENELGVFLFNRTTRNVEITEAGWLFVMYGEMILGSYQAMTRAISLLDKHIIRIGIIDRLYNNTISRAFSGFFNQYPDVRLELNVGNTSHLVLSLEKSTIDIAVGVLRDDILNQPQFTAYPLAQDEWVLAVSRRHPLSARAFVALEALTEERFIALDASSSTSIIIEQLCKRHHFTPQIMHRCSDPEIMLDFVCQDKGVAIFAKRIVAEIARLQPDLRYIPLNPPSYRTLGIIVKSSSLANSNIQNFIHCLLDCNKATPFWSDKP